MVIRPDPVVSAIRAASVHVTKSAGAFCAKLYAVALVTAGVS